MDLFAFIFHKSKHGQRSTYITKRSLRSPLHSQITSGVLVSMSNVNYTDDLGCKKHVAHYSIKMSGVSK